MKALQETVGGIYISPFTNMTITPTEMLAARSAFRSGIWAKDPNDKIIDIEAFHKGWDTVLNKYKLFDLFDKNGDLVQTVNGKPSYALIKEFANKNPGEGQLVAALKAFWGANYSKTVSSRIGNKNFGKLYNKKNATSASASKAPTAAAAGGVPPAKTVLSLIMPLMANNLPIAKLFANLGKEITALQGNYDSTSIFPKFAVFFFGDNGFSDIYKLTLTNYSVDLEALPSKQFINAENYTYDMKDAIVAGIAVSMFHENHRYIGYFYDSKICPPPKRLANQSLATDVIFEHFGLFPMLSTFDSVIAYVEPM